MRSVLRRISLEFLHFSAIFHPSTHYMRGRALSPANSLCSTAEGFPTGIPISLIQPSCLSTWRLAGSIPRARLPQLHAGVPVYAGRAFLVLDREVDQAAFGPVWLRDARVARVVADALMYGESGRHLYHLRAWGDQPGVIIVNNHAQPCALTCCCPRLHYR